MRRRASRTSARVIVGQSTLVQSLSFLDAVRKDLYASERTHVRRPVTAQTRRPNAHRTATGDLAVPRRLRRPARLSPDRARDRRSGRARLPLDRARAPRQPRPGRPPPPRPAEPARARPDRPPPRPGEAARARPDRPPPRVPRLR